MENFLPSLAAMENNKNATPAEVVSGIEGSFLVLSESIAHSPDRLDPIPHRFDLFSQAADMGIHGSRISFIRVSPHGVKQMPPCLDPASV